MKTLSLYKTEQGQFNRQGRDILNWIDSETQPGMYWLTVLQAKEIRTIQQNSYYWGVVIASISDYTGYKPEELHNAFKNMFLGLEKKSRIDFATGESFEYFEPKSTTRLSKRIFTDYCNKIKDYAIQEIGVDFGFEDFDYFIEKHPEIVEKFAAQHIYEKTR